MRVLPVSVLVLAGLVLAFAPHRANAHVEADALNNNRYVKLDVSRDRVRVVYTIYFGDAPALAHRRSMDTSGDGSIDDAEAQRFGDALAAQLVPLLSVEIDQVKATMKPANVSVGLGVAMVAAGSFSVDVVLEAPVPPGRTHTLYFAHSWEPERPGETEIMIQAEPGLHVTRAHSGRQGQGIVSMDFKWMGSSIETGEDRSVLVGWEDPDAPPTAGPGSVANGVMPWWLALSHRPDLGAQAVMLALLIALLLGALDSVAPARMAALMAGPKVVTAPIGDALARSLLLAIVALPVANLSERVPGLRLGALTLAAAGAVVIIGMVQLGLALRSRSGPTRRPGDDALRTAVRSPALWATLALIAFFGRTAVGIVLASLFAAGNLLASATLSRPEVRARWAGPEGARIGRAALVGAGTATVVFGLGLLALAIAARSTT